MGGWAHGLSLSLLVGRGLGTCLLLPPVADEGDLALDGVLLPPAGDLADPPPPPHAGREGCGLGLRLSLDPGRDDGAEPGRDCGEGTPGRGDTLLALMFCFSLT